MPPELVKTGGGGVKFEARKPGRPFTPAPADTPWSLLPLLASLARSATLSALLSDPGPLTPAQIAGLSGLTPQAVRVALKDLRHAGLVRGEGRRWTVTSPAVAGGLHSLLAAAAGLLAASRPMGGAA